MLAGAGLSVQFAVNSLLRQTVGSPALSALISFLVGTVALIALTLSGAMGPGRLEGVGQTRWWYWIGGLCGAFVVTASIVGVRKIGGSGVVAATVFGQMLAALLLDNFGWLGVPRAPLTAPRVFGALLLLAGVLLIQLPRK